MTNYKFKKRETEPSDEEIKRKMDFQSLLQKQQDLRHYGKVTQPLYKKPWFLGFLLLIGIILLLLILDEQDKETQPKATIDSTVQESSKTIQP